MKYVASCSFGKDSLATIILALKHGEPLDEIMYCEVMFDHNISGEIPEHIRFIQNTAIPWIEKQGIRVVSLRSNRTYVENVNHVITRSKTPQRNGKIRGFPLCGKCAINRDCKMPPIKKYIGALPTDTVQYLGIAKDEQERLLRLDGAKRISLLDKYGVTEQQAFEICRKNNLLSPMYEFTNRGGCFFWPNAKDKELRHLYDHHPDLWGRMLELQALPNKATELFNRTMRFDDIDRMFRREDDQMTLDEWLQTRHEEIKIQN